MVKQYAPHLSVPGLKETSVFAIWIKGYVQSDHDLHEINECFKLEYEECNQGVFFYLESLKCFNENYIAQGHFVMLLVLYARLNQTKQLQIINQLLNPFPNDKFLTLPN